jgi:hypothetical protein
VHEMGGGAEGVSFGYRIMVPRRNSETVRFVDHLTIRIRNNACQTADCWNRGVSRKLVKDDKENHAIARKIS